MQIRHHLKYFQYMYYIVYKNEIRGFEAFELLFQVFFLLDSVLDFQFHISQSM